jgi:hypothetical protein
MSIDLQAIHKRLEEIKQEVAQACIQEPGFRQQLVQDPQGTLESHYNLPQGALSSINIHVVTEETGMVVLPIPPDMSDMELNDEQLEAVAGGWSWVPFIGRELSAIDHITRTQRTQGQRLRAWG